VYGCQGVALAAVAAVASRAAAHVPPVVR
jgi:hypothetical protein